MARVVVLLVLLLGSLALAQDSFIPAVLFGGFEIIFSNDTSFIDEVDLFGTNVYVASEGAVREVTLDPFQLSSKNKFFTQAHRFVDFRAFNDSTNNTWVFGPTTARGVDGDLTVNHPVQLSTLGSNDTQVIPEFLLSCVSVRSIPTATTPQNVAYLAGWEIGSGTANFVTVSLTLNPSLVAGQTGSFATIAGSAVIYSGNYDDYSRSYKPRIFRSLSKPYVIVVDPTTSTVYKIDTEDTKYTLSYTSTNFYALPNHVAGSAFDHDNGRLFVGLKERGYTASKIIVINTDDLSLNMTIELRRGESYPKALGYRNNVLYAGINGGHSILQIDVSKPIVNVTSFNYATLPWYLRSVYSLVVSQDGSYVYFGTYEQRAKVARVRSSDFCPSSCDHNFGYCQAPLDVDGAMGECHCISGYVLNDDGYSCDENATVIQDITQNSLYKQARAGNVALGLLFAATFVTAAIGWFLLWRHKKGDGDNKRYGALPHQEEHENFLGGGDDE